jgi:hypothetical protein
VTDEHNMLRTDRFHGSGNVLAEGFDCPRLAAGPGLPVATEIKGYDLEAFRERL